MYYHVQPLGWREFLVVGILLATIWAVSLIVVHQKPHIDAPATYIAFPINECSKQAQGDVMYWACFGQSTPLTTTEGLR